MKNYKVNDVAVAILSWNGKELLRKFLPSVLEYSGIAKIYVIDNASTDDSIAFLKKNYPNIKIIKTDANLGYAGGYNYGVQQISEPIICCLNSDVEVSPNWLDPILNTFNSDNQISIIQPKILDFKQKDRFEYAGAAGGFIDKFGYPYCRGRIFEWLDEDTGQYNDAAEVFWASGACFFIRKDHFLQIGGFDPDFFAHMEEIDLCWRAFNMGLKVYYQGNSKIYHVGGSTLNNASPQKTFLNFRNSLFALLKNSPAPFMLILIRLLLDGAAGVRFLLKFQFEHFLAILHAHFSFYYYLPKILHRRKEIPSKRRDYYSVKSIVWQYFVKKETTF